MKQLPCYFDSDSAAFMSLFNNPRRSPLAHLVKGLMTMILLSASVIHAQQMDFTTGHRPVAPYENRAGVPEPARSPQAKGSHAVLLDKVAEIHRLRLHAMEPPRGVPPKIGFPRDVTALREASALAAVLDWELLPTGGRVAAISISSPEAAGMRVGILVSSFPQDAILRVYAQNDKSTVQQVSGEEILAAIQRNRIAGDMSDSGRTYWTPLTHGSEVTVEIELPAGVPEYGVSIAIPRLSHLFFSPREYEEARVSKRAASCNLDVSCYLSSWVDQSKSVALMDFIEAGHAYVCSGTLLADSSNSFTPYFLSANHCISDQTTASTLETTWFHRSTNCNSTSLYPGSKTLTGGATLLYQSATTDTSFMRLNKPAPDGAIFSGWLPALPAIYNPVTGVHHPNGDWQKISFGYISDYVGCHSSNGSEDFYCSSASAANAQFLDVTWQQGITEVGSSGSGLWARHTDNNYYLVGALYGGSSSCTSNGTDTYGRFDLAYNTSLKQWLNGGGTQRYSLATTVVGTGTVSSNPAGINCGDDCLEVFDSGTQVVLTATPGSSNSFHGWGGSCSGTSATCALTMSETKAAYAFFLRTLSKGIPLAGLSGVLNSQALYAITIPAGAASLQISTSGGSGDIDIYVRYGDVPTVQSFDCASENPTNAEACSISAPSAGTYYILLMGYKSYSGATLTATYATTQQVYSLTVTKSGTGSVTSSPAGISCGSDCTETYLSGSSVTLTATADAGSTFSSWGGACSGSTATCTVAVTAATSVTANFSGTGSSSNSKADCLFGWAELNYPELLAPSGAISQTFENYYFRCYSKTESCLATLGGGVYYFGPLSGNTIIPVDGSLSYWLSRAGCN